MAKKKRKSRRRAATRRAAPRRAITRRAAPAAPARRRRRSSVGGGSFRMMPSKETMVGWGIAGAYGFVEGAAKSDSNHLLNKVPKFVPQVGFTGNVALNCWVLGGVLKNRWLRKAGDSVAHVAAYQLGMRGTLFTEANEHFTVSGPGAMLDVSPEEMEHLAAAMAEHEDDTVSGDEEFVE